MKISIPDNNIPSGIYDFSAVPMAPLRYRLYKLTIETIHKSGILICNNESTGRYNDIGKESYAVTHIKRPCRRILPLIYIKQFTEHISPLLPAAPDILLKIPQQV